MHNRFRSAGLLSVVAVLVLAACDTVCPGGHDPKANPEGDTCRTDSECRVECICVDAADTEEEIGVIVGECMGGSCVDVGRLCDHSCGRHQPTGEYCAVMDSGSD